MSSYWHKYWADQKSALHRKDPSYNLRRVAAEQIFHLEPEGRWLDFGCGSADMLQVAAPLFESVVGVDLSPSLLAIARERLATAGQTNVELYEADHKTVWDKASGQFDRVSMAGVCQFLTNDEVASFLKDARSRLTDTGRIVIFDVLDPARYALWKAGFFKGVDPASVVRASAKGTALSARKTFIRLFRPGQPLDVIGYTHPPKLFADLGAANGLEVRFVQSMYLEYRYHAILEVPSAA